jgi:hypothetical protein
MGTTNTSIHSTGDRVVLLADGSVIFLNSMCSAASVNSEASNTPAHRQLQYPGAGEGKESSPRRTTQRANLVSGRKCSEQRNEALVNGTGRVSYGLDTMASRTCMTGATLARLRRSVPIATTYCEATAFNMGNAEEVICTEIAVVSLQFPVPTGSLTLRNVPVYILPGTEDTVLLIGVPELQQIGYQGPEEWLSERCAQLPHVVNVGQPIDSHGDRVARLPSEVQHAMRVQLCSHGPSRSNQQRDCSLEVADSEEEDVPEEGMRASGSITLLKNQLKQHSSQCSSVRRLMGLQQRL